MKQKVAVITNRAQRCGIHQYGRTVQRVLNTSTRYQYDLVCTPHEYTAGSDVVEEYLTWLQNLQYDALIYNHCPSTMAWLTDDIISAVDCPQFVITGHDDLATFAHARHHFVTNPLFENTSTHSALLRPIILDHDYEYQEPGSVVKVGTLGLAYNSKNLPLLVQYVNNSFAPDQQVVLNIHATVGHYVNGSEQQLARAIATCGAWCRPNVKLNFTTEFINSLDDVIGFLNSNDINVFLYNDEPTRFAVSSALDLALSARKPIAISGSSMFAHARHISDIVVDLNELQYSTGAKINWLPEIMEQKLDPLLELYSAWSPDKFCQLVEEKLCL